ncbi:NfeD family protein [Pleionea sp. CnH1-48]|uniref:NfeD family protein n=1 Tax=Pleionea sp. CnH1-48 TaxID=2954494 RepID=UPI002097C5D7|nr:NfeD family protein [Pleionea sp. CnH1-48]MCO7225169.1 NfeD family protein [Pleionea sp. CnH1-48]
MIVEWLTQMEFWHWMTLGLLLFVLEMFAPGAIFMWAGFSALVVGVVQWLVPDISWQFQWILFSLLSLASVIAWRYFAPTKDEAEVPVKLNQRSAALVGRRATLSEPIVNGFGRIQIDDTFWRVEGADMPTGTAICVIDVDGATLKVEAVS